MKYSDLKFFLFFFISLFLMHKIIFAEIIEDQVFTIRNISVDVKSASSSKAREIALQEAQIKGFSVLMQKMLLKGEYEKISYIKKNKIMELVQEIEIENEKTSSVRYIGTISVKFKSNLILRLLKSNNIKFSITKSKPLLILPIYKYGGITYLWDDKNVWKDLWNIKDEQGSLIPIRATEGKFKDFIYINPNQAIKKNLKNLKIIAANNNSTGVLVAILKKKYNRDKSKIMLDLDLSIYRFDENSTNNFKDTIEVNVDDFSDDLFLEAKLKVENFVKNQWKVQNVLTTKKNSIKLTVNYDGLNEWVNIRNLINNIDSIDKYIIENFSKDFAVISVSFSGNYEQLRIALQQSDLEFDIRNKIVKLLK
tara:strand:- start:1143 stop:2240 length:1098 start_codon:yes stop_codon:yes gene_type:complete